VIDDSFEIVLFFLLGADSFCIFFNEIPFLSNFRKPISYFNQQTKHSRNWLLNLLSIRLILSTFGCDSRITFMSGWSYWLIFLVSLFDGQLDMGSVKYNYFVMLQVCVDVFVTTQTYVDIASISVIPRTTGGQVNVNYYGSVVEVNDWSISLVGFYLKWIDQIFAVRMNK